MHICTYIFILYINTVYIHTQGNQHEWCLILNSKSRNEDGIMCRTNILNLDRYAIYYFISGKGSRFLTKGDHTQVEEYNLKVVKYP